MQGLAPGAVPGPAPGQGLGSDIGQGLGLGVEDVDFMNEEGQGLVGESGGGIYSGDGGVQVDNDAVGGSLPGGQELGLAPAPGLGLVSGPGLGVLSTRPRVVLVHCAMGISRSPGRTDW